MERNEEESLLKDDDDVMNVDETSVNLEESIEVQEEVGPHSTNRSKLAMR